MSLLQKIYSAVGGRKVVFFLLILLIGIVFQSLNMFSQVFSQFLLGLGAAYGVSNAASKFAEKRDK
jgi:uncharacterized membrane protein